MQIGKSCYICLEIWMGGIIFAKTNDSYNRIQIILTEIL